MSSSFISKKEVSNYPIIGTCARILNCLFIDRLNEKKNHIIDELKERAKLIK